LLAFLLTALVAYGRFQLSEKKQIDWKPGQPLPPINWTEVRDRALSDCCQLLKWKRTDWHFFLLGAAFMLLETQNISKASVVLGNTWLVNAVIVSGIMMMILISNSIASRFPKIPKGPVAFCLIGTCVVLYFIDLSRFAFLPFATKAIVVGSLTT